MGCVSLSLVCTCNELTLSLHFSVVSNSLNTLAVREIPVLGGARYPYAEVNSGPHATLLSNPQSLVRPTSVERPVTFSCAPAFNVVVMNSDQNILAGNLTFLGNRTFCRLLHPTQSSSVTSFIPLIEPTFDCSKTITPQNIPVGTGYTMFLTNAINTNQVIASHYTSLPPC